MARWLVLVASIVASGGCYHEPRPACGFVCGEGGACPGGYTCDSADNRCHLDGTSVQCDSFVDAAVDAPDLPPMVVARSPDDGATDVALDATVVARFSEPVTNFDAMSFQVSWSVGAMTGSVSPTGTNPFGVRYTPDFPFPGSTPMTATLTSAITDVAGNPLPMTSWTFTTVPDTVAPVVTATTPVDGGAAVPVDATVDVMFSKAIGIPADSWITVAPSVPATVTTAGHFDLQLMHDPFAPATTYTVTVTTDVADISGNHLAAPFTFSFTTM
jgi:hypothetical protein